MLSYNNTIEASQRITGDARSETEPFGLRREVDVNLLYGGYRLPHTDIRSELYPTISKWCVRGIVIGLAIMMPIILASEDPNIVGNTLLLTGLGSLAGFGIGTYDARAKTRHLEPQATVDQLETSNERLERHQQYADDILDAINDVFDVLYENGALERWNQGLSEVSGYTDEETHPCVRG
ncbi:hypothetical protein ACFQDG_00505 [Natronoarchaeum mannanilyticum]|uniref:Archaeal histidine kinase 4TM domain-containing protein n=1 Tax=Natronoarchaeum mannanilyticum TaxID=926360 RepID=A0AAV3THB6_9EURY